MARKVNNSKSKRRPKSGRRKDYTRTTALALRSPEAINLAFVQLGEIQENRLRDRQAEVRRSQAKQAAHAARHGAKQ
jgi:hypothetical protein